LWGSPIFSNVNKNWTTVTTALGGAWGGPVSTTSQNSTAVQSENLFSNLTIFNNDKTVVTSTNIPTYVTSTINSPSSLSYKTNRQTIINLKKPLEQLNVYMSTRKKF
jgi:hypothetical protein